jgi:tetratricopeptide (TPR) repeat protein
MFSDNNVQAWLDKGAEAFANLQLDEATQNFQNAVAADPHSVKAQLSLGVMYLFAYQNGVSKEPELPPDWVDGLKTLPPPPPSILPRGKSPKWSAQIVHQNATNGAIAEQHLKEALQLEPHYEPALEYLAALYFWWRDPATELWARRDDARQSYERILHTNPQHKYAHYMCGVIDSEKAMQIIRSTPGYPRPLTDESRRSVQAKAGSLLAEGSRNLLRSLEIEPNNSDTMTYLGFVKAEQAYLADTTDDSARLRAEAAEWYGKVYQIMEAQAKATGQPEPPGDRASITFERVPQGSQAGKRPIPPFPPDARLMIPPPPPPPPPAFK